MCNYGVLDTTLADYIFEYQLGQFHTVNILLAR